MAITKSDDPEIAEPEVIIDDPATDAATPDAAEPEANVDEIKAQLAKLKAEHDRSQAELAAERQKFQKTATELSDSRLTTIAKAIEATDAQIKEAHAKRRAALEAGDWDAESTANDELTELKITRSDLNRGKTALEREIEAGKSEANIDPAEKMIQSLSPISQGWARQHADLFRDPQKFEKLVRADYSARADGIVPDTAEYFQRLDERMGYSQPIIVEEPPATAPRRPAAQVAPAAPPSRSAAAAPNGRPGVVRLTADEIEAARISNMTPAEYAAEKERLRQNGELGKFVH